MKVDILKCPFEYRNKEKSHSIACCIIKIISTNITYSKVGEVNMLANGI